MSHHNTPPSRRAILRFFSSSMRMHCTSCVKTSSICLMILCQRGFCPCLSLRLLLCLSVLYVELVSLVGRRAFETFIFCSDILSKAKALSDLMRAIRKWPLGGCFHRTFGVSQPARQSCQMPEVRLGFLVAVCVFQRETETESFSLGL